MVGDSLVAIEKVDDAALRKTVFQQGLVHGGVIPVGVDADVAALGEGVIEAEFGNALAGSGDGDAMDDAAFTGFQPCAVIDLFIGGVITDEEAENTEDFKIFFTDEP